MHNHILEIICKHYGFTKEELGIKKVRRQPAKLVEAKQVCAFFLWKYTRLYGYEIGKLLGYPGKQNVNSAKRSIKKIASGNHAFNKELEAIENLIIRN